MGAGCFLPRSFFLFWDPRLGFVPSAVRPAGHPPRNFRLSGAAGAQGREAGLLPVGFLWLLPVGFLHSLPLEKHETFRNFSGNMGYMRLYVCKR